MDRSREARLPSGFFLESSGSLAVPTDGPSRRMGREIDYLRQIKVNVSIVWLDPKCARRLSLMYRRVVIHAVGL